MQQRLLIAAFILGAALVCLRVPTAGATALGLADGTYEITISGSVNLTGTMTIGPTPLFVTFFDVGAFECTDCIPPSSPDSVGFNSSSIFTISDSSAGSLVLNSGGTGIFSAPCTGFCSGNPIAWTATAVPEPASSAFFLLGIGVLALRARKHRAD